MGFYHKKIIPQQANESKVLSKDDINDGHYHVLGSKFLFDKIMALAKEKNIDLTEYYDETKPLIITKNYMDFIYEQDEKILELRLSDFLFIYHVKELEKRHNCQCLYEVSKDFHTLKRTLSNMLNAFKQCVNFTVNKEIEKLFIENVYEYSWERDIFFEIDFEQFEDKKDELKELLQSLQNLKFIQNLKLEDKVFYFSISYETLEAYQAIYSDVQYCIKVEEISQFQ